MEEKDSPTLQQEQEEVKGKRKTLVVILMGPPGSGKTTFCNDVMSSARRCWVRICQDTIANGKAGAKSQCLKSAADALKDGKSVFIDRCNLERDQRADFLRLGGAQADVHAVVLDLPARLCISRSVNRTGHEGNLQGGKAAAVVNRMLQKKELPQLSEGFSRITFCQNENDVKNAVKIYSALDLSDTLPSGVFGQRSKDAKVQLGIMKFLKKVEIPENETSGKCNVIDDNTCQDSIPRQETCGKDLCSMELEMENKDKKGSDSLEKSSVGDLSSNDVHTLAFPSISTADFQFDHEKASDIIVESVADFLRKVDNVRLVLVDLSHKSNILSLVRAKAAERNIDSKKFFTFVGDITQLYTKRGLRCNVIANAANWRLKPGGGGVNAAIFKAAGKSLEIATKERIETLSPGNSVAVPLPSTSPLYKFEGVTHVIHVLGPNMNPQRPNYLKNNYVKGCMVLRDAYSSLFEHFASISKSCLQREGSGDSRYNLSDPQSNLMEGTTSEQFPQSDQKIKREDPYDFERNKRSKGILTESSSKDKYNMQHGDHGFAESGINSDAPKSDDESRKTAVATKRTWGSWAQALYENAMHPEKHKNAVMEISNEYVVLNDRYPKAKKHILVLSRLHGLDCLADVQKEHLPLMKQLHAVGVQWAERFLSEDASLVFRLGYHSVPSMRQLHLHVISQDFDSTHLKNKKHWNSFNTAFFRDSTDAIEEIDKYGAAKINDEKLLTMELRCHRCRSAHPNIPKLKSHVANCKFSFPSHLLHNGRLVSASSKTVSEKP
ncbi:transcription factor bHLH140 isoform X2 [Phoenix dactylifera]|uniref:Transcription factor bHLH140 isoform X2 n=1 Tax=Phoenix dactylifera TaxID=42345 RepID=A0A8B7C0K6_PHODC|nr:transcription factor bHLH140 isoform X2 [Phoenix dactylifera]